MSLHFNKNALKEVYDEEIRRFGIGTNATNRIKQLLDRVDNMMGDGQNQLTQQQLLSIMHETNTLTSADVVAYCLQSYYDQDEVSESLYSSGIERTAAFFNNVPCEPAHPTHPSETKTEYIESVLFRCFSNYMIAKGYRAKDIYRCMIRFGCMFNPRSNIIVKLFNNLSNGYFLRSENLEEGSEYGFADRNAFTGQGKTIHFTSMIYSRITSSSFSNVSAQPFMLSIDYGNVMMLDARPYAYILPTLLYMSTNRVGDYEGIKRRVMQEGVEQRQKIQQRQQEIQQRQQEKQAELGRWLEARTQGFLQAGGGSGKRKSKKNRKTKHKNKSRRRGRKAKSQSKPS